MTTRRHSLRALLCASACALACAKTDVSFQGLAAARHTGGPTVRFDLETRPLPEVPFPNDLLTRVDAQSPTHLRVNLPLNLASKTEQVALARLNELDGFATFAPISVSFDKPLDVLDLWTRQNDADPTNDAVFVIDLASGERVRLDVGGGHFPYERVAPAPVLVGDPLAATTNLLFPTDGPLANFLHPADANWPTSHGGVPQQSDDLMSFFERATNTLLLRPVVPLLPRHTYAVVLTSRLKGLDAAPVQSPLSGINHFTQTQQLSALPGMLPLDTALDDVAFVWSFTTQSTTADLEQIRDGMLGSGPFRDLSLRVAVQEGIVGVSNTYETRMALYPLLDDSASSTIHLLRGVEMAELLEDRDVADLLLPDSADDERQAIVQSLDYVDYFVSGQFEVPNFLWDPDRASDQTTFELLANEKISRARPELIPFLIAIPKADPVRFREQPFPAAVVAHDFGSWRLPALLRFAGTFAHNGLATVTIDAPGHGAPYTPAQETALINLCANHKFGAFANALFHSRAHDLDNDGVMDPGADLWTADAFHTRDVIRQSAVDQFQLARLLATFDRQGYMELPTGDFNFAGDFDGDGVPDLGGPDSWPIAFMGGDGRSFQKGDPNPGSDLFFFGLGLGGLTGSIAPALEPAFRAAAITGMGGGLTDLALRTSDPAIGGLVDELAGPVLTVCAWSKFDKSCSGPDPQPTLVWSLHEAGREVTLPISTLRLQPGDELVACDVDHLPPGTPPATLATAAVLPPACARASVDGNSSVRLALPVDRPTISAYHTPQAAGSPDLVDVTLVRPGDEIQVAVLHQSGGVSLIDHWEQEVKFAAIDYAAQSPLRAPGQGYGRERNTPELRRLLQYAQTALETGDPINYARAWRTDPVPARSGLPLNMLVLPVIGDPVAPVSTALALGRAAGLVELDAADAGFGMTIDRVLLRSASNEGVARLMRFQDPSVGPLRDLRGHLFCDPGGGCDGAVLPDLSGLSCDAAGLSCTDTLSAPRLSPPLRGQLVRESLSADGNPVGVSALEFPFVQRSGAHALTGPRPARAFDVDLYLANQVAHYFETRGKTLTVDPCLGQSNACDWTNWTPATP